MKRLFTKNPHLKVLAFALTVVLYFFVLAEKETTREFTVEVDIGRVPAGFIVMNEIPDLTVQVSGSARAFGRLDPEALRTITIDVADPEAQRREIREADFGLPRHFRVASIVPRWVDLEVEELEERELPVRPVVRGTPARGYEASDPVTTPDRIAVTAPSSYFPDLDAIFTEGIDITGASAPVSRSVGLSVQRPYVTWPPDTRVRVHIDVVTVVETRTIEGVGMLITGPHAARCWVNVGSIAVTVTGPKTLVDTIEPSEIFAGVDCDAFVQLGPGVYTPEPIVKNLARGITVVETVPALVQLTVAPDEGDGGSDDPHAPDRDDASDTER